MTPGVDVLTTLLEECAAEPHLTTAGVLERWREHRYFRRLEELAGSETLINDRQAVAELGGLLKSLADAEAAERRRELLDKSRNQPLSEQERVELNNLLAQRVSTEERE